MRVQQRQELKAKLSELLLVAIRGGRGILLTNVDITPRADRVIRNFRHGGTLPSGVLTKVKDGHWVVAGGGEILVTNIGRSRDNLVIEFDDVGA